jgi:hypothetical protein
MPDLSSRTRREAGWQHRRITTASYIAAYWKGLVFDPKVNAFLYVRVLEIPSPRSATYDVAFFNNKLPHNVPTTLQNRSYTSPAWYSHIFVESCRFSFVLTGISLCIGST